MKIEHSPVYLDTNAVWKLYVPEESSKDLNVAVRGRVDLYISDLVVAEMRTILRMKKNTNQMLPEAGNEVWKEFRLDIKEGRFTTFGVSRMMLNWLKVAIENTRGPGGFKTLDALHVACALGSGATCLVTFDRKMMNVAKDAGLIKSVVGFQ